MARVIDVDARAPASVAASLVRDYLRDQAGFVAFGEGGALFMQPSGMLGAPVALFDDAISAMMAPDR